MNIFGVIASAIDVLRKGKRLNNVVAWKNVQIVTNMLAAIVVLLRSLGFDLGLSDSDIDTVAGAIVVIINVYLTLATTNKVGISQEVPPIELQGRAEPMPFDDPTFRGVRDDNPEVPSIGNSPTPSANERPTQSGWNG